MGKFKPLIGITPGYDYEKDMLYLKNGYYEAVGKAGGLALAIPPVQDTEFLDEVISKCSGFLISGGPDLDAGHFGENNMPCNGEISPWRDYAELYIVKKSLKLKKPVLGICRGIQVINVAMGGTIYQDIFTQKKDGVILKHSQNAPRWYPTHDIYIEHDSIIEKTFGNNKARVNSFHHQAVKDVAPGFVVTSKAEDDIIESIEYLEGSFAVGVQWHPELMWQKNDIFLNLFSEFVKAAGDST